MAQDPLKPRDNGRIRMPRPDGAMIKIGPTANPDDKMTMLGYPQGEDADKEKIMDTMRKRMEQAISAESENRKAALDDKMFVAGNQWPVEVMAQRNLDKRPCLTINKLPTFIHQVVNAQRENRPSINVSPVGDRSDPEVAKMYRGVIRFIERDCFADIAYDTAFDDAVTMGWGYFRILTEWEAPDSLNLVAVIRRIRNAFTVYMDPQAQDPTGADAKWCFVSELIPREEFRQKWPDATEIPYADGGIGEKYQSWVTKDEIRIVEYFEIVYEKRTLVRLSNGHVGWKDELDDITKAYIKKGRIYIDETRESRVPTVKWYKATAVDILMQRDWIGTSIPIIRVIGNEIDIEGKSKLSGLVRFAKDPQRMYNYWRDLSLDTPIPTPDGWKEMRDIHAGSEVFGPDGTVCKVLGESPVYEDKDCYRVTFDDGSSIVTSAEHTWTVEERGKRMGTTFQWTTKDISTVEMVPGKHFIWLTKPLALPEAELPIPPYVLGMWLGDGTTAAPIIHFHEGDVDEISDYLIDFGCKLGPVKTAGGKARHRAIRDMRHTLVKTGLLGSKHIPKAYLRASEKQRWELLQGLMDSDGSVSQQCYACDFTTTIPALAEGFAELLRSLGIKAKSVKRARTVNYRGGVRACAPVWQFHFTAHDDEPVFRLKRKQELLPLESESHPRRTKRYGITSVERVDSVQTKCIMVDNPSHLFLAGEAMIPTHNTAETELIALQPKAPWVLEEGQVEGHEDEWKGANTRNQPYLSYKGTSIGGTPAPPPQRQPMAGIPTGVVQAAQGAAQDMMTTTGIRFDASLGERMVDESGKAIRELRRSGDIGAFHYIDNLGRALRRCGEILVEIIPKIYNQSRIITILREDDTEEQVRVEPTLMKGSAEERRPDGKIRKLFNPAYGKYGVTVTIGPSYATKRIEASESMMSFMKALPSTAALVVDLFAKNQDWPGAEEIAARLAKTIPPNLMQPDMKDVPPQVQAIIAAQEQSIKQLTMELKTAMAALQDKNADRALDADKIQKTYETALLKIISDTETKMAKIQEQATANFNTHITAQVKELGGAVQTLEKMLEKPSSGDQAGESELPPEAVQHLKQGRNTRFRNGQTWTLGQDGKPMKVAS